MEQMRLQKYLSQNGVCSRRKAEDYIARWLVFVNWEAATIWMKVTWEEEVTLWTEMIEEQKKLVYYKINKPRGIVTTCASHDDRAVIDIIDVPERIFPIWRLDKETTGLLLLTNDWRLANYLMHPKYEHSKEYVVEVFWPIDDKSLDTMAWWMFILWWQTKKTTTKRIASGKFSIVLKEWKNRQIRRMVEKTGNQVKKLKRIRIENIELWNLGIWEIRHLSKNEIDNLFDLIWVKR